MRSPACRWLHHLLLTGFLLLYLTISLDHLGSVPPLYADESWQASTAWKLATQGVFGSDMFAGLSGMERHYYGFMPLHPMLQALVLRFAGLGVVQVRSVSVAMGLLTLVLTYALGRRLFGASVGLLSVALLLFVRLSGLTRSQVSGILLLDIARIARYDILVPVFGLAALHAYISASRGAGGSFFAAAGLLAGLSGLSHLYGLFWVAALGLLALWDKAGRPALVALALGCAFPWLCYAAYVLSGLTDWLGQMRVYADRFRLLDPAWYWQNLLQEPRRYGPGLGPLSLRYLLRPGFWAALAVLPASLLALGRRAVYDDDRSARALFVPAILLPVLFALLLRLKLPNYAVAVAPLGALVAAWGGVTLWRWAVRSPYPRWIRGALLAALLAVGLEGATRMAALHAAGETTTPYADFVARVHAAVPPGSRVLGMHDEWLGLQDLDYRAWIVPLAQTSPAQRAHKLRIEQALERINPDVILINTGLRAYFNTAPASDRKPAAVRSWMRRRGFSSTAEISDPTYGRLEVFVR